MTRGFVTLATGDDRYYQQAFNLLRSFRLFNPDAPFAILCDRTNQWTKAFSDTVILENAQRSYLDKFFLLTDCPYDENIFIEPDCLVYHNLDHFWKLLSKDYDLTSFGGNQCQLVFFSDREYAAEKFLGSKDALVPNFNPGYLFIRNGSVCRSIYEDAMRIIEAIKEDPRLNQDTWLISRNTIRDDPVFFLAMKKNGCGCAEDTFVGKCVFLPSPNLTRIRQISLSRGKLDVDWYRPLTDCNILHFSSRRTREEGLYPQQVMVLNLIYQGWDGRIIRIAESKPVFLLLDVYKKGRTKVEHILKRTDK